MLEVRNLTKLYVRRPAVDDVSFTIRPGEILGYLGPNGSGKSTTVKMLTGLLEPSRGLILYQGRNIRQDLIGYKKSLGYVPEEPNLYPYLTGREYLQLVGRLRCLPSASLESQNRPTAEPARAPRTPLLAHLFLFEGHEAENPDLGGLAAQPRCAGLRRAALRAWT